MTDGFDKEYEYRLNYFGQVKSHILSETNSDAVVILMECHRQAGVKVPD